MTAARHLLAGVIALDALVHKATPPHQLIKQLEGRLNRVLAVTFSRRAHEGTVAALRAFTATPGKPGPGDAPAFAHSVLMYFDGWEHELAPLVHLLIKEVYTQTVKTLHRRLNGEVGIGAAYNAVAKARKPPKINVELVPSFDLQDKAAIDAISSAQLHWIGDYTKEDLARLIEVTAREVILEAGLGREEAAKELQKRLSVLYGFTTPEEGGAPLLTLPGTFPGTALDYLGMVSTNITTVARTNGSIRGLANLGLTTYTVVNPVDERTCSICSFMVGKEFTVKHAIDQLDAINSSRDKEEIKTLNPWASLKEIKAAAPGGDAKALQKAGFSFPPFHGRCRCAVDMSEDAVFDPRAG